MGNYKVEERKSMTLGSLGLVWCATSHNCIQTCQTCLLYVHPPPHKLPSEHTSKRKQHSWRMSDQRTWAQVL